MIDYSIYSPAIIDKESSGKADAVNRLGYLGLYQMGAPALADAGFVKRGTTNKGLNNPKNWIVGDKKEFLSTPELQDKAFQAYTNKNYERALKKGLFAADAPVEEKLPHLAGAHLVGFNGYMKSLGGADVKDANGIRAQDYYNYMTDYLRKASPRGPMPDMSYEQQMAQNEDIFQNSLRNMMLGGAP